MLTVILRHDQSKTLDEIDDHLAQPVLIKTFHLTVLKLSPTDRHGIGHIITLRLPPEKLREVMLLLRKDMGRVPN